MNSLRPVFPRNNRVILELPPVARVKHDLRRPKAACEHAQQNQPRNPYPSQTLKNTFCRYKTSKNKHFACKAHAAATTT